ncbi:NNP family nitrate/nitrite transporter-like MFS transporter [Caulobacter ginsengisoli]|uniref:NNP family nitrate/nitrite transporter-like MFS transporter n=1 Tax=Caulobacter ginsengisoli TaxID=400775 RepID=A0ABU0IQY5_9CAUL|nr:nitrate/nitrite transporter [Caulobacter ginsengisoli]MDQ0464425.1 NNP family nitrate/nitrite transporter-like MFS transporter [Caulobacter ginsengisoli]
MAKPAHVLSDWRPEDPAFWAQTGKPIATRNLWISVPNLLLAFAVWMVWSMVVAKLKLIGFKFTTDQLFWLTALPALSGATLRIFYSFLVPILGGRLWTTVSTLSLLAPAIGIGVAVQNPDTPYWVFVSLSLLCGLGGGNFASSMANISFFFPKAEKGNALAVNAGFGNLGVSVMQFLVPIVTGLALLAPIVGGPQLSVDKGTGVTAQVWMQNAGFVWVPFIVVAAAAAWFGMNDIASAKASFATQAVVFKRRHNWIMCWLYLGTFGSFLGFSAAFPLLSKTLFPHIMVLKLVFLGPLVGAASRALTGWVSDKFGGEHVTQVAFLAMAAGVLGVLQGVGAFGASPSFPIFFGSFLWLFFWTGVGNASTFQMIPAIVRSDMPRLMPGVAADVRLKASEMEAAAIVGFTSAIGAFGGFFIPKAFGDSIKATGGPETALYIFLIFYVSCIALNWAVYARKGSLLHTPQPIKVPAE